MNIAKRMEELIPLLHRGINGVRLPDVKPECIDEWSDDYAIIQNVYWEEDDHYFDEPQFRYDLGQFVRRHFGDRAVLLTEIVKDPPALGHEQVVVRLSLGSQEIEVYRIKPRTGVQPA